MNMIPGPHKTEVEAMNMTLKWHTGNTAQKMVLCVTYMDIKTESGSNTVQKQGREVPGGGGWEPESVLPTHVLCPAEPVLFHRAHWAWFAEVWSNGSCLLSAWYEESIGRGGEEKEEQKRDIT